VQLLANPNKQEFKVLNPVISMQRHQVAHFREQIMKFIVRAELFKPIPVGFSIEALDPTNLIEFESTMFIYEEEILFYN